MRQRVSETISFVRTDSDLAELLGLFDSVFGPEEGSSFWLAFHGREPFCKREYCKVVKRGGHVVAHVSWVPRRMHVGLSVIRAGAVGWVATHREHRRLGLASALMEDWTRELTKRGEHLSFLTGIAGFYEQFGYEFSFREGPAVSLDPDRLPKDSREIRVRRCRRDDLHSLVALYDRENTLRIGSLVRAPEYWEWLLDGLDASGRLKYDDVWLAEDVEGRVAGYVMSRATPQGRLEVWEAAAADGLATALLAAIAARARSNGSSRIDLMLPLDHGVTQSALAHGAELATHEHGIYARILDLGGLFEAMQSELGQRLRSSREREWRGTLRVITDVGTVDLAISDGDVEVRDNVEPLHVLELPQALLVKLVTGYADVSEIAGTLDALGSGHIEPALWPIIEALFPSGCPYIWNADTGY